MPGAQCRSTFAPCTQSTIPFPRSSNSESSDFLRCAEIWSASLIVVSFCRPGRRDGEVCGGDADRQYCHGIPLHRTTMMGANVNIAICRRRHRSPHPDHTSTFRPEPPPAVSCQAAGTERERERRSRCRERASLPRSHREQFHRRSREASPRRPQRNR